MPLDGTEGQALANLGQGISQSIMLNTRARMVQQRIAQQQAEDFEQAQLRKMQQMKLQQEVNDLVAMQDRIKRAGTQVAADFGNPNMQSVGEIMAGSPAAMVNFSKGIKTNPGQQVDRPFAPRIVNEQPRVLGLNQSLVGQDGNVQVTGMLGGQNTGIYKPGETNPIVPPAPRYSTPQGDVEQLRLQKWALSKTADELEKLQSSPIPQVQDEYEAIMRLRALGLSKQPVMSTQVGRTNAPAIRKYNPATGRIE